MRASIIVTGLLVLAGCTYTSSAPEPDPYPSYPYTPPPGTYDPGGTTTRSQVTYVDYWYDDGGVHYYDEYYPGAVFVPGSWNEYYFPQNGCYVPGGVLLGVDRPHGNRQIPYRVYRGHNGSARTGYTEMRDEPARHRKDRPGRAEVRDDRYLGNGPYGPPADNRWGDSRWDDSRWGDGRGREHEGDRGGR